MNLRLSISEAARAVAILSVVACSNPSPTEPGAGGTGGGSGSGGSAASGGAGGSVTSGGSGGQSSAGHGGGGQSAAGGQSAGGTPGTGGSSGMSSAGTSAGGAVNLDCSAAPSSTNPAPTFCTFKFVMLNVMPPCNSAPCHGVNGGGQNPLEMPSNNDTALMTALETTISPDCGNIPIITPGDPTRSALVKVLSTGCSQNVPQMPYGCDPDPTSGNCVPAPYQTAISQWIQAGAKLQ